MLMIDGVSLCTRDNSREYIHARRPNANGPTYNQHLRAQSYHQPMPRHCRGINETNVQRGPRGIRACTPVVLMMLLDG